MKLVVAYINVAGSVLANHLARAMDKSYVCNLSKDKSVLAKKAADLFASYSHIVFIGASGIVIRLISPCLTSKYTDPAVVCVDTAGRYAISLLSGHEGGANNLAYRVAAVIGAQPIITTGSESHKKIILGLGCRRGASQEQIKDAIVEVLMENDVILSEIRCVASIDIKRDEPGLIAACAELNLPLVFFCEKDIRKISCVSKPSRIVKRNIGVDGVCEPCALLAGHAPELCVTKKTRNGVTIACAKENFI